MASLLDFWPTPAHCDECLKNEAETAADAVFLAVHQPMRLVRQFYKPDDAPLEVKNEDDLLKALLARTPGGTLVLPITGASGVGKSHMIRWLDACLRLRADRERRHVVRVPKSASLKRVLSLILDGLPDARYATLRGRLTSARMPPSVNEATWQLLAQMILALEETAGAARQAIAAGGNRHVNALKQAYCLGLKAMLTDPHLATFFTDRHGGTPGAVARIASRCIQGNVDVEEAGRSQFLEADLQFVRNVNSAEVAGPTRAFLAQLRNAGPAGIQDALKHLNEAVDPAVQAMINFDGVTLTELLVEVRQELLKDGLELVLLIEDFAALAGIQRSLLDAIIYHGVETGDQGLCVMRTALAVTEGYLTNKETVTTRAQAEWRIENRPFASDEEAIDNFTDFVGGYLNASRWGAAQLQKDFVARGRNEQRSGTWVRNYFDAHEGDLSEGARAAIVVFGKSKNGDYPLFPFNRGAVRQLARLYLREGNTYKFEPRLLINRILRDTLVNYRETFENSAFPPPGLHGYSGQLDMDVQDEIRLKAAGETERNRLEVLVFFWGNKPRTLSDAADLPSEVYEAFALKRLPWSVRPGRRPPTPEPTVGPSKVESPVVPVPVSDPLALPGQWQANLDSWREEGDLKQGPANRLRGMLYSAIHEWIDWDALLLKCPPVPTNRKIYLPGVQQSNPPLDDALAVALSETNFRDPERRGEFFRAIRAVIRYEDRKSWNYDGGERDAVYYANFIGQLAEQAAMYYETKGSVQPLELVKPLAQALLVGARLLNLDGGTSNTDADNMDAIFRTNPHGDFTAPVDADAWPKLKSNVSQAREGLKTLLLASVGIYQGTGVAEQAVDATPLLDAIRELRANHWQLPVLPDLQLFDDPSIREHFRELKKLPGVAEKRRADLEQRQAVVQAAFGTQFDAQALTKELCDTVTSAQGQGVFRPEEPSPQALRKSVREMGPVTDTLNQTTKASQPGVEFGVMLSALAQIDDRTFARVEDVVADYQRFLKETLAEVTERLGDHPPNPDATAKELQKDFEKLKELWSATLEKK